MTFIKQMQARKRNMQDQDRIARFAEGRGFVAALDQSGGSTGKALALYGVGEDRYSDEAEMMALMHEMRVRIMTASRFSSENILGAILFERTMMDTVNGVPVPDHLWNGRGILPFLKIDAGLDKRNSGISLMKAIPKMDDRLGQAVELGMFGTKMRSVIHEPTERGVKTIVSQQFEFADLIAGHGLLPIVEPEVSIDCEDKARCEDMLFEELSHHIGRLGPNRKIALKLTLPENPGRYADIIANENVVRVTALSGGYDRAKACRRLAANSGMIASFSRALVEGLVESMDDPTFDRELGSSIERIFAASCT